MVRIALAQMDVKAGNPRNNADKIIAMIEDMRKDGVELGIFPEMCVPGYLIGDAWEFDEYIEDCIAQMERIRKATGDIAVIAGSVFADFTKNPDGSWKYFGDDGRLRKWNAAWVMQNGVFAPRYGKMPEIEGVNFLGRQPKTLHPNYREFDDDRYFYSLRKLSFEAGIPLEEFMRPFVIHTNQGDVKVAAELCEDLWCQDYMYMRRVLNVTRMHVENGADMIVNISCSPGGWKKNDARHRRLKWIQQDTGKDAKIFVYVNNVGTQNNGKSVFFFDGRSAVYNHKGEPILDMGPYDEKIAIVDLNLEKKALSGAIEITGGDRPSQNIGILVRQDGTEVEDRVRNLLYACRMFQPRGPVLVGLSGGIDSAVVAALYAAALGHERVLGINMPTSFNTDTTKNSARQFAINLGIHYAVQPIQEQFDSVKAMIMKYEKKVPGLKGCFDNLLEQNIQPKIRFVNVLSNLAAYYGGWFTSNANKTEIFFGYETLDGGLRGACCPIGDLYKYQVKEVAVFLNKEVFRREVIPWDTIDKLEPSAELSADQNPEEGRGDPMHYPYHDFLAKKMIEYRQGPRRILEYYLRGTLLKELGISQDDLDAAIAKRQRLEKERTGKDLTKPEALISDLEWAWSSFVGSYFKRVQAPPIFVVSKRGFGFDLRECIKQPYYTNKYLDIKEALLRDV